MKPFSEKIYLEMDIPTEEANTDDLRRLKQALAEAGCAGVQATLGALRQLHTACAAGEYRVTATLVRCGDVNMLVAVEAGDRRESHFGLAVDYGSTTIVMQLVNLNTGEILAQRSLPNGQAAYGSDILTRITYIMEDTARRAELRQATVETFHALMAELRRDTGVDAAACPVMILSGNTTMIHFLLELDAWTVFASPYAPVTLNPGWFQGRELGMDFSGMVYIIPAASNYVGGDIISGLLTMDFYRGDELGLFFDIGTNGELVMGNRHWLLAGAGAAGPALEGYISRRGMRAQPGAIDHVFIEGEALRFTTIGGEKPVGICGSGIIDLIAQMRLAGWINIAGELNPAASRRIVYLAEEQQYAAVYALPEESADGEALCFTQTDIRQYLETKAAAHTMVDCLLETAGVSEADISRFYLSGAFTAHSNLESAITVGIFPDLPRERFVGIANSSLDGARTLLLDADRMQDIDFLLENIYCVQFASVPDFLVRMHAAKFIPHTDMRRYPVIQARLPEGNA